MLSSDFLFPRFLVVPPANPSNFSHCKCFSNRIPFLFQYRSINLRIMTCMHISGTSRGSTEVQEEKTGLIMSNNLLLDMLNL